MTRWIKRGLLALVVLALLAILTAWWALRGSLPRLDGEQTLPELSAPVSIQRDALGVVTIDAGSEADAMRALGYVHAQERYFEMDLLRRTGAGELAELFGPIAVDTDKRHRAHRFRARVSRRLPAIAGAHLPQLEAYVAGVNAGLGDLRARPWPYLLLRQTPAPWQPADSPLVGYAMYFDLQDGGNARELALWRMRQHLPPALFALLTRDGTRWDAPLMGTPRGDATLPDAAEVDLRALPVPADDRTLPEVAFGSRDAPGSNNFAVAGVATDDGRAIVADDMHLSLRAPNIWFRARLRYPDPRAPGGKVDVSGFTLPGLPGVVVGSNGHVAWGFTNSYGDYLDWKREPLCAADGAGAEACSRVRLHRERIAVAKGAAVEITVEETDWGPVLQRDDDGTALSLRWSAHAPGALNLGLLELARAANLAEALASADRIAIPTQNLVIGDRSGDIAWRLLGPIPQREGGCILDMPMDAAPGAAGESEATPAAAAPAPLCPPWQVTTAASPAVVAPASGRLWTANARVVDGETLARVGNGGYALGARGKQIRDGLLQQARLSERDLLAIQLDDRALFLTPWWQLLREQAAQAKTPALSELAGVTANWEGRATPQSVSYRIVRAWRLAVHARLVDGLTAPAQAALGEDFVMPDLPQFEGVVWPLVMQRPAHLLPRRFAACDALAAAGTPECTEASGWNALFEDAAREVRDEFAQAGPLLERTWGERNAADICHPLAGAIPLGKRLLCMPSDPLPGDAAMPRVQGPRFGASQRMVVAPGRESDGIAHMPGGQSGHPLSPFWGAGHDDWVQGRPTPFLPGEARHALRLVPAGTE